MTVIPQARRLGGGGVELRFPYDAGVVDMLKTSIPARHRAWDPALKVWTVDAIYAAMAIRILKTAFPDASIIEGSRPNFGRPEPIRSTDALYRALHLLPSAPPELVEAAYKALTKLNHPDRRPPAERERANEAMVELNQAYGLLRDRASA